MVPCRRRREARGPWWEDPGADADPCRAARQRRLYSREFTIPRKEFVQGRSNERRRAEHNLKEIVFTPIASVWLESICPSAPSSPLRGQAIFVGDQALAEPLDRKRRGIGERRLAGHHFRKQAARHGSQRQPVMLVAEVEPQPRMARRLADDRQHV